MENNVFRPVYRELSDEEKKQMEEIKNKAQGLYVLIENLIHENPSPKARYVALAKTNLEEAVMWSVKALTI
jgi:hypothetical protein